MRRFFFGNIFSYLQNKKFVWNADEYVNKVKLHLIVKHSLKLCGVFFPLGIRFLANLYVNVILESVSVI